MQLKCKLIERHNPNYIIARDLWGGGGKETAMLGPQLLVQEKKKSVM